MKTMKKMLCVTLAGIMLMSLAGCAKKIESVKKKDFKNAIETVIDEDDYYAGDRNVYTYQDNFFIEFYQFEDEDDAADAWEDIYDGYEDMVSDKKFDGKRRAVSTDTYGYILLNGDCSDKKFLSDIDGVYFLEDGKNYYYGGIYFVDDEIMVIMTTKDKDSNRSDVNTILSELGYPKP